MTEKEPPHKIFKKKGLDGRLDYITCITCNTSYPSAEAFLKEHLHVGAEMVEPQ